MTLDVFHLANHVVVVDVEALGRCHVDGSTVAGSLAHFGEPAEDWAAGLVIVVAELGFQCLQRKEKKIDEFWHSHLMMIFNIFFIFSAVEYDVEFRILKSLI